MLPLDGTAAFYPDCSWIHSSWIHPSYLPERGYYSLDRPRLTPQGVVVDDDAAACRTPCLQQPSWPPSCLQHGPTDLLANSVPAMENLGPPFRLCADVLSWRHCARRRGRPRSCRPGRHSPEPAVRRYVAPSQAAGLASEDPSSPSDALREDHRRRRPVEAWWWGGASTAAGRRELEVSRRQQHFESRSLRHWRGRRLVGRLLRPGSAAAAAAASANAAEAPAACGGTDFQGRGEKRGGSRGFRRRWPGLPPLLRGAAADARRSRT